MVLSGVSTPGHANARHSPGWGGAGKESLWYPKDQDQLGTSGVSEGGRNVPPQSRPLAHQDYLELKQVGNSRHRKGPLPSSFLPLPVCTRKGESTQPRRLFVTEESDRTDFPTETSLIFHQFPTPPIVPTSLRPRKPKSHFCLGASPEFIIRC